MLRCGAPVLLLPLDVTRKLVLAPSDLTRLPGLGSRTGRFLKQIVPHGIAPTASLYGVEGVYLQDVFGVVAVAQPAALTTRPIAVDVETRGELTRGMSVFDVRWSSTAKPNAEVATAVDVLAVRQYINHTLARA